MNILALTSSYPRYEGDPTAPFIESITTHVAAEGHSVHVVLPENSGWKRDATEGDIHFHPYRYSPSRSWTPWGFSESLQAGVRIKWPLYALAPAVLLAAARKSSSVLRRERFDLVQAHWIVPNGPIAARAAARSSLPLVVSLHGSDISVAEHSGALGRAARWTFGRAAAVTAPSDDLLERAQRLGAKGLLERIPYGADVEALTADPGAAAQARETLGLRSDAVVVAGIGRFVHWKGFDYLIEAFAKTVEAIPELRLVLIGDGDLRDELTAHAQSLGVAEAVVFPGMATRDAIPAYLAAADIVAVPSIHYEGYVDGLPNVALEAMAAGKPLIATRVGGLPQLVRAEENGLLVDEKDAVQLAEAIATLARDATLRRRLGANAQTYIRDEHSWKAVAERFVSVYERVLAGR
jgi:phosphatidyl-myo-inositol dimannoside synthase